MIRELRESLSFQKKILSKTSETLEFKLLDDNIAVRVKKISITFANGVDNTLQVRPYALDSRKTPIELLRFVGSNYIVGNGIKREFETDQYIENHSAIYVFAENVGDYDYTLMCDIEIEYVDEGAK